MGPIERGCLDRLLLSQHVFLKMMPTRYGGFGYASLQRLVPPRPRRHGATAAQIDRLMVANPCSVFSAG